MPKISEPKLYNKEILDEYDYFQTKEEVLKFFAKYRTYKIKVEEIYDNYNSTFSDDQMGIFSSKLNDPTAKRALKIVEYKKYLDAMDKKFKALRLRLTSDEKIIFNYTILSKHTDEELAEKLSLDKSNIYLRKKSCYIKVAKYFHIDIFK